jgi:hypothetical protein
MRKKEKLLGLSPEDAKQSLMDLRKQADELNKKVLAIDSKPIPDTEEVNRFKKELEDIKQQTDLLYKTYNMGLLELLHQESKRLNMLTKVLIAITLLLGLLTAIDILSKVFFHA